MRTVEEIQKDIDACCRPSGDFSTPEARAKWQADVQCWRQSDEERYSRFRALIAEMDATEDAVAYAATEAARAAKIEKKLEESRCGSRLIEESKAPKNTEAVQKTRLWYRGDRTWLVLCGENGVGKSVAAVCALRKQAEKPGSVSFRSMAEVVKLSTYGDGAAEMEHLKRTAILVLDDMGAEYATKFGAGLVFDLVDARHRDRKRTIVTSNLPYEKLKTDVGARIRDRWLDGEVYQLKGESMRKASQ